MDEIGSYSEIFKTALNVDANKVNENLEYNGIDEWDSIGHMTLISELEDCRCCCVIPVAIIKYWKKSDCFETSSITTVDRSWSLIIWAVSVTTCEKSFMFITKSFDIISLLSLFNFSVHYLNL